MKQEKPYMRVLQEKLDKEICMDLKIHKNDYVNLNEHIPILAQTIIDGRILNICLSLQHNEDDYDDF